MFQAKGISNFGKWTSAIVSSLALTGREYCMEGYTGMRRKEEKRREGPEFDPRPADRFMLPAAGGKREADKGGRATDRTTRPRKRRARPRRAGRRRARGRRRRTRRRRRDRPSKEGKGGAPGGREQARKQAWGRPGRLGVVTEGDIGSSGHQCRWLGPTEGGIKT